MSSAAVTVRRMGAFFRRDLRTDLSYKLSFLLEAANVIVTVASFYFLSKTMGERASGGYAPFPYLLVGMAVNGYLSSALYCFAQGVRGSQQTGVLKAILGSPITPLEFLLCSSCYPIFRAAVDALIYLAGGFALGLAVPQANLPAVLVLYVLSVAAHAGIGIFSATFTLVFKKGDPIVWLFVGLSWLLGGVFYPLEVLPQWMQRIAGFLPVTHALRGMRLALLDGATLGELSREVSVLGLFVVITVPLGAYAFRQAVQWTRRSGSLGHV